MKWNGILPLLLLGQMASAPVALAQTAEVAGLRPDRRPTGAPVIERHEAGEAAKARALKGIDEPRTGVAFLKDQEAWYTPFDRPNLLGRYDIRHLHDNNKQNN